MRVAIDVTPAAVRQPTGVAVYIDRLVRALPFVEPTSTFVSTYRLFRLWQRDLVPVANASNAARALVDERVPFFRDVDAEVFHGADIRLPKNLRVPAVATIHDLYSLTSSAFDSERFTAKRRAQYERAAREAAVVVTHSEHVRREAITHLGIEPGRVRAVALGVDPVYAPMQEGVRGPILGRHGLQWDPLESTCRHASLSIL